LLPVSFYTVTFYNFGKGGTIISFEKESTNSPVREIFENVTVGGFRGVSDLAPLALACKNASVKLHPVTLRLSAFSNFDKTFYT
jgi:hypothetical protein